MKTKRPGFTFGNVRRWSLDSFLSFWVQKKLSKLGLKKTASFWFSQFPDSWNGLTVWSYPDPLSYKFIFDLLIRGFIPTDLTQELSKYLYKKDVSEAINLIVSKAIDIFHEDIWAYRCQLFTDKERSLGIDQSAKTSRSSPSVRQAPFSSVRRPSASPSRWMTWISQSLLQRKPWTDFCIYING